MKLNWLPRPIRRRIGLPHVRQADRHRGRAEWIDALVGYRRGLDWMPWREDLKVQIGNCLKEFGDYRGAVKAYGSVVDGAVRPEALKQIAEANRRANASLLVYATAETSAQVVGGDATAGTPAINARLLPNRLIVDEEHSRRWLGALGQLDDRAVRSRTNNYPSVMIDQVGAMSIERDGALEPFLTGVIAIRARIVSSRKLETVKLQFGEGKAAVDIATVPASPVNRSMVQHRLSVINAWIDAATLPEGRHWLRIVADGVPAAGLFVTVGRGKGLEQDLLSSNAYLPSPPTGTGVAESVANTPALARSTRRSLIDRPVKRLLVMRVDQLGDVSASMPAVVRLKELFPEARVTMLVQPGVKGVVEASGVADEVLTLQLDYNAASERRHLRPDEEQRIRALLAAEAFDLAIDLNPGDETRPLLMLSNAYYLAGFNSDRFTFLDFGIGIQSRDKVNQIANTPHGASVMALVEALAVAILPNRPAVPRVAPSEAILAEQRLEAQRYIVLHTGARHPLNCWPHDRFLALAKALIERTPYTLVVFSDGDPDAGVAAQASERLCFMAPVSADAFDAIVANARLLVGNDTGPKHLAAMRGVPTVSIHVGRLNWNEWGQEGEGLIVSKRVPCTGCGLNDVDLCGREVACIRTIGVDEVLQAVLSVLGE